MVARPASIWPRALLLLAGFTLLLSACQSRPQGVPQPADRAATERDWPEFDYAGSALAGHSVFRLDPRNTLLEIVVRRDGPLARFGHDHVVTVQDPEGFLQLDTQGPGSRADLRFRLDRLVIDSAEARARHDLDTAPDASDIEGTRRNLMDHVLEAERWPLATLELSSFERQGEGYSALVAVAIRDSQYRSRQSFSLGRAGDRVVVEGFLTLRQTDLGIEPFSALGGGLRVADTMEIHFRIEAGRQ